MHNKTININTVAQVAQALQDLKEQMVFVGGAVISMYTDDPAADEIRPTGDIDLTIQLGGFAEWSNLQERLAKLGFSPDPEGRAICSYLYKEISVDIMPAQDSSVGKSNRWYKPGFGYLWEVPVKDEKIRILSVPYFLATKFEAFNHRGGDYRTSHDFEDIIYVIDNRMNVVAEILAADKTVQTFLVQELSKVLESRFMEEIISSQISPLIVAERYPIVLGKIRAICKNPGA